MKRFILSLLALLFSLNVHSAPTINVIPNQSSYQVGDSVLLAISLSDAPDIHGGGLNISFNPTVIQAQSVVIDSVWKFATRTGVINNAQGSIADILFSNFNTVSGDLGVAIVQMTIVGDGDAALFVTESAKNPFSDDTGQVIAFDVNNLFAFNTQVAETETPTEPEPAPAEETPVSETAQPATTTTQTAATETVSEPITQTPEQTSTQTTSTDVTTTNNNTGGQTFSSNIASVNFPNKTVSDKQDTDSSQGERKILLPSGSSAIPIKILDDAEMQQQIADDQRVSSDTYNGYNQQSNTTKGVDESLLASAESASEGQNDLPINEMQSVDINDNASVDSPTDYLTFVLILAVLFVGFIVFKVFFKK